MASIALDASLKEILDSLDLEKTTVPEKLRCTNCHNLNLSPHKTICCGVLICESCFTEFRDSSCPKCDHKPFTDEICPPNKAMRTTVKTWLKNQEKVKLEVQDKSDGQGEPVVQPAADDPAVKGDLQTDVTVNPEDVTDTQPPEIQETPVAEVLPSIEEPDHEVFDNDDDIEFQVELDDEHEQLPIQRPKSVEETPQPLSAKSFIDQPQSQNLHRNNSYDGMNGGDLSNSIGGFNNNNMDQNQVQQMMQMISNGMPMNPMMMTMMSNMQQMTGMINGFGGQNGGMNMNGMNGMNMNMGMSLNPNQGYGWNDQNNNMWQNNNANAFPNAMGNDFSTNYGFNMEQPGNFQQQNYSGDFQNGYYNGRGYGRGRGRGRGGFGRGRGNFNQYSQYQQQQGYQNGLGPRQFDNRNTQSQMIHNDRIGKVAQQDREEKHEMVGESHEDDEFAPGGQEEVQEALGEDYQKSTIVTETATPEVVTAPDADEPREPEVKHQDNALDVDKAPEPAVNAKLEPAAEEAPEPIPVFVPEKPIPEAYNEDLQGSMAPPSAPTGPSAKFGDFGFRSRGGRFSSRGRDSMSVSNGHITSPVKPFSPAPPPTGPKGDGVVGAPTGPRAMREPAAPARPVSRSAATGFQIMGRASMAASSRSESRDVDRERSKSPDRENRDLSRQPSRQEKYRSSRHEADEQKEPEYRDQDKRSRRSSKRDTYDDLDRDEQESSYAQSESAEYKSSSRRSRTEKERPSKHSSRSRRHREEDTNGDHEMDDYEDSARSSRDAYAESRSKHRSSKSSKYDDREREKDRDRDRERERPRETGRDKDKEREDRHQERDREHSHRKRSRNDRHREDNGEGDYDYEKPEEAEEPESRHHSRRHKKEHRPARDPSEYNGTSTSQPNGRTQSHRSSAYGTPVPQSTASTPIEPKDMYTNERERLAQERMLAEKQRRAKQRTTQPKFEDDLPRALVEGERARHGGGRPGGRR